MKKWLVLLLALVMVFSLAACNGEEAEEQTTTETTEETAVEETLPVEAEADAKLVVWESEDQYEYMTAMAEDFTAKYNIPVEVQKVEITDQIAKLTTATDETNPDVVVFPHDKLGEALAGQLVLENTEFAELTKAGTTQSAINAVTSGGKLYGYPKSVESVALIYNKGLVATPPATWDEVIALAGDANLHNPKDNKYVVLWEVAGAYHSYAFVGSNGGYVFGDNGSNKNDIGVNNEGAVKGLTTYKDLKDKLFSDLKSGDASGAVVNDLFNNGKVAMTINGPWAINDYKNAGIDVGVAKIPAFTSGPAQPFGGVRAYYVSSKAKYPNAAKIFAYYATSKDAQVKLYEMKNAIPANNEAAASDVVKADPVISGFASQFEDATPMPSIPEMGNYWGTVGAALAEIFDKGTAPKAAADNAAKTMADAIAATQ